MQLVLPESPADPAERPWFTVHTDVFEGPLDLLLHLVHREGIDLGRLEVARIADAYLAYLDRMRALDLSIASDWLVMAATLVHLKSLELFPRLPTPVDEDAPDPREVLAEQLREYERVRVQAEALGLRPMLGRDRFARARQASDDAAGRPVASPVDAFGLLDVLFEVLARGGAPEPVVLLAEGGPDVGSCCRRVLTALGGRGGTGELGAMLRSLPHRPERVVTFVGVLEMARLGWLDVAQEAHLGPVRVEQLVDDEVIDLALVLGWDEPEPGEQMTLPLPGIGP